MFQRKLLPSCLEDVSLKLYSLTIQYDNAKDETFVHQAASDKTHLGH